MPPRPILKTDASAAESTMATLADFRILNLNEAQSNPPVQCHCSPPLPALRSDHDEHISNPSRLFYTCPREEQRCSFFQWGDAPKLATSSNVPSSAHAIIRALPKSRYDSLVKDNADAALSYVDEDDGEKITVGSGYELEQRLKDPVNPAAAPKPAPGASSVFPDDVQLLHNFDLNCQDDKTIRLWQSLQSPWPNVCSHDAPASVWTRRKTLTELASGTSGFEAGAVHAFPTQPGTVSNEEKQKPLLELFETELAKLVPPQEQQSASPSVLAPRTKKRVAFEPVPEAASLAEPEHPTETTTQAVQDQQISSADPDTSVPPSNPQHQRKAGEAFVSGLQTFISGVGSFAARVDEANPQFREHISHAHATGQEAAFNLLARLLPEIQTRAAAAGINVDLSRMPSNIRRRSSSSSTASPTERSSAASNTQAPRNRTYEAERILSTRYICYDNLNEGGPKYRQFLVRWAGCGPSDDVWYDEDNLKTSCQPLIDQFERSCGSSCLSPVDAAQVHRRTAANRMVASMIPRDTSVPQNCASASLPTRDSSFQSSEPAPGQYRPRAEPLDARSPSPQAFLRQPGPRSAATVSYSEAKEPQSASIETIAEPSMPGVNLTESLAPLDPPAQSNHELPQPAPIPHRFDPADLLAHEQSESSLRHVRSVLPFQNAPRVSEDAERWARVPGEQGPLRRAKSLAFRERPHGHALAHVRRVADDLIGSAALPRPHGPGLRRAATLDHKRTHRLNGLEAMDSTFEAARERYLSRRAATARSTESSTDDVDDKVARCTNQLISMGYRRAEAEPVAAICEGDLSKALDQLEEDRKAWLWRSSRGGNADTSGPGSQNMPGSWDVYRW